ncbi:MAG: hypothetical protein JSW71_10270, partial [Gemmatimonadota bacterium]
ANGLQNDAPWPPYQAVHTFAVNSGREFRTCLTRLERFKAAVADRYAMERKIGSGAMATVYLAEGLLCSGVVRSPELIRR